MNNDDNTGIDLYAIFFKGEDIHYILSNEKGEVFGLKTREEAVDIVKDINKQCKVNPADLNWSMWSLARIINVKTIFVLTHCLDRPRKLFFVADKYGEAYGIPINEYGLKIMAHDKGILAEELIYKEEMRNVDNHCV